MSQMALNKYMNNQQTKLLLELVDEKLKQDLDRTTTLILENAKEELKRDGEPPYICEKCNDVFYENFTGDKEDIETIEETGLCYKCNYIK